MVIFNIYSHAYKGYALLNDVNQLSVYVWNAVTRSMRPEHKEAS